MGGNKTALAAMELLKRTTLKGEEVAVYLDVVQFLESIHKGYHLVVPVADMEILKKTEEESERLQGEIVSLRQRVMVLEDEPEDDYVAPITPEEAGLEDIEWFHSPEGICPKCSAMLIHYSSAMETYRCFSVNCNWQGDDCNWGKTEDD